MHRPLLSVALIFFGFSSIKADDGLLEDDDRSTVRGSILDARGEYAEGLGRGAVLRSMSAVQLQEAIDKRLSNRKERVQMYYDLKDLRDEEVEEDRISASKAQQIASDEAPDRLNDEQINQKTGEVYWPKPLDHAALKPYRKPIEDSLGKRSKQGNEDYGQFDFLKVHRMVKRMKEAVESIEDKLDPLEVVALKNYLDQIDYEARFDRNDERVDF